MTTPHTIDRKQLRTAALNAAGWPAGSSGQHQLLTVSSQLRNPISTPARVLDVLLQAYAISVVALLAGSFGAFFHRRGAELDPPSAPT